jgi:hypothetical protein
MQEQSKGELPMNVSREVILDLLPLYIAGEASPETCSLVEEYLDQDMDLRSRVEGDRLKDIIPRPASGEILPADLELRSLHRTRGLLRWQQHLYAWAMAFSIASFGGVGYIQQGHPVFHFFFRYYPQVFGPCISIAINCWIFYFVLRWRLRSTKL